MKAGIIGYGSMGKMLLWKFSEVKKIPKQDLLVNIIRWRNRQWEKSDIVRFCRSQKHYRMGKLW